MSVKILVFSTTVVNSSEALQSGSLGSGWIASPWRMLGLGPLGKSPVSGQQGVSLTPSRALILMTGPIEMA